MNSDQVEIGHLVQVHYMAATPTRRPLWRASWASMEPGPRRIRRWIPYDETADWAAEGTRRTMGAEVADLFAAYLSGVLPEAFGPRVPDRVAMAWDGGGRWDVIVTTRPATPMEVEEINRGRDRIEERVDAR